MCSAVRSPGFPPNSRRKATRRLVRRANSVLPNICRRGHRRVRRRRAADERAPARSASHLPLPRVRRGSGRSSPGPRRAARFPSDQDPQHAAGIAVTDSGLPARRGCGPARRPVGAASHAGKRGPTSRRWHLHPVVGSRAIGAADHLPTAARLTGASLGRVGIRLAKPVHSAALKPISRVSHALGRG